MKKICIYHGNCADGFGAAWVVRKALGDIAFVAETYQNPPPDVTGKDVIMVDFSYKRPVLLEMAEKAHSILILDHHKTAWNDLIDLPTTIRAIFDMNRSGAMLAYGKVGLRYKGSEYAMSRCFDEEGNRSAYDDCRNVSMKVKFRD